MAPVTVEPDAAVSAGGGRGGTGGSPMAGMAGMGGAGGGRAGTGGAMPPPPPRTPDAARPIDRPPPDADERKIVLYITGSGENADFAGDDTLIDRVEDLGFRVNSETDTGVDADDIMEATAILLSASTDSATVLMALPQAAMLDKPILAMDENLEPPLNLAGTGEGDRGTTDATQVAILADADPALTAGLAGTVTVYSETFGIAWGVPGPGALKVATVNGNATEVAIFAYPKGSMMANNATAPAKRAFYFVRESANEDILTEDGLKLFDAMVKFVTAP
jgi:hypothetical protein